MYRLFLNILIVLFFTWTDGFAWFVLMPPPNITQENLPQTEAIAVFTGGENRVAAGLNLFIQKKPKFLFVSGVAKRTTLPDLIHAAGLTLDRVQCCVEIGRKATDTIGNAIETSEWLQVKKIDRIVLVTSGFHMRRALMEMKIFAPNVTVYPFSVIADKPRDWKNWKQTYVWRFHINEYNKYIFALLRFWLH